MQFSHVDIMLIIFFFKQLSESSYEILVVYLRLNFIIYLKLCQKIKLCKNRKQIGMFTLREEFLLFFKSQLTSILNSLFLKDNKSHKALINKVLVTVLLFFLKFLLFSKIEIFFKKIDFQTRLCLNKNH